MHKYVRSFHIWGIIIIIIITTVLISACGKQKVVDYDLVDKNTEENDILKQEPEDVKEAETQTQKSIGHYTQEWNFTDENGKEHLLHIDVEAMVPNVERMSIIEVERRYIDEDFHNQLLHAYYGDSNSETGKRGEILCKTYTNRDVYNEKGTAFYAGPIEEADCYPKSLSDYEQIERFEVDTYDRSTTEPFPNECKYTMAEAQALAEAFLDEIGQEDEICYEAKPILWSGKNSDGNDGWTAPEMTAYGYYFTYGVGVEGIVLSQGIHLFEGEDALEMQEGGFLGDSISFMITDEGILIVDINYPVTIRTVSPPVDLLPVETILDIMQEEAKVHYDEYAEMGTFSNYNKLDSLTLNYFKVGSKEEPGVYTYIPVWQLSNIYVNAVDGSVAWNPEVLFDSYPQE